MKIAILGAQGSGKTQLAHALAQRLNLESPTEKSPPVFVADAPPLMAAVEADLRFNDHSLYAHALAQHTSYDLTLLLGLDLPWRAAAPQTSSTVSRDAVDTRLRKVLTDNKLTFTVIYGLEADRLEAALNAIIPLRTERIQPAESDRVHWQSSCEKCSDPVCEHRLFTGRLQLGRQ
jgi:nicotinamide riboside kinase